MLCSLSRVGCEFTNPLHVVIVVVIVVSSCVLSCQSDCR